MKPVLESAGEINWILEKYSLLNDPEMFKRFETEEAAGEGRGEYQRDYARILYSSSFRRLQGKMQLLGIENDQFFRNRLTHSLEVSQIAEGIVGVLNNKIHAINAEKRIYLNEDIFVLRAACLAHDIGNPPFGHAGEKILNKLTKNHGGFEGNAQTIRVLKTLEKKSPNYQGLNLTLRSLLAVLKYNVKIENSQNGKVPKKFIYEDDFEDFKKRINLNNRTLDVQIMDLADEIAYSAHDLEDCLNLKIFDIDELLYEFELLKKKKENEANSDFEIAYTKLKEIINESKKIASECTIYGSSEEYKDVLKKNITSTIVNSLIRDIGIIKLDKINQKKLGISEEKQLGFVNFKELANGLKSLTFKCLKRKKHVKLYEAQGKLIIEKLYNFYLKNYNLIGTEYVDLIEKEKKKKRIAHEKEKEKLYLKGLKQQLKEKYDKEIEEIIVKHVRDYISGMMDSYAFKKYNEFFGEITLENL